MYTNITKKTHAIQSKVSLMHTLEPIPVPYSVWLKSWKDHLPERTSLQIPLTATGVQTPLIAQKWESYLEDYCNHELVQFFLEGITQGFKTGFNPSTITLKSVTRNLPGALLHPEVVEDYIKEEFIHHRFCGPYPAAISPWVHISWFGVIPKNRQPGKWRLIVDLSHPTGHSVNDGIPSPLCSLSYISVDDAVQNIIKIGRGALLAKVDIKSAFRLLPVHPSDRHLIAMKWNHHIYIDACLPFGLRSAPKLFNILADLLTWIAQSNGVTNLMAFFGFLRSSEFTVPSQSQFDPNVHLCLSDISLDSSHSPQIVQVNIKQSKTDPFRQGITLSLGCQATRYAQ